MDMSTAGGPCDGGVQETLFADESFSRVELRACGVGAPLEKLFAGCKSTVADPETLCPWYTHTEPLVACSCECATVCAGCLRAPQNILRGLGCTAESPCIRMVSFYCLLHKRKSYVYIYIIFVYRFHLAPLHRCQASVLVMGD